MEGADVGVFRRYEGGGGGGNTGAQEAAPGGLEVSSHDLLAVLDAVYALSEAWHGPLPAICDIETAICCSGSVLPPVVTAALRGGGLPSRGKRVFTRMGAAFFLDYMELRHPASIAWAQAVVSMTDS